MWQNDVENIHKARNGMVWNFCCFYYEKKMLLSCFKLKTMLNEMKAINYLVVLIDGVNSATLPKPFNIPC